MHQIIPDAIDYQETTVNLIVTMLLQKLAHGLHIFR